MAQPQPKKRDFRPVLVCAAVLLSGSPLVAAGAQLLKDVRSGASGSLPDDFTQFKNKFYFGADDGTNGQELWVSDGTQAGTSLFKNINSTSGSSPTDFVVFNGSLFFSADDGVNGRELWVSDGTTSGTVMLKDINSAAGAGSDASDLVVFDDKLYFSADDGLNGKELWESDGTAAGTQMAEDINSGSGSSSPSGLAVIGNDLYLNADDGTAGPEPWVVRALTTCQHPLDATATEVGAMADGKLVPFVNDQAGLYTVRGGLGSTENYVMFPSGATTGTAEDIDISTSITAVGLSMGALPDVGVTHGTSTGDVAIQLAFYDASLTEIGHLNYQRDASGHWIGLGIGPGTDQFYQTDGGQVSVWFDAGTGTWGAGYVDQLGVAQTATRASYTATSALPVLVVYEQGSVNSAYAGQTVTATLHSAPGSITAPVPSGAVTICGQSI